MKKLILFLPACLLLGGCMATIAPCAPDHTAYVVPVEPIIRPAPVRYVHARPMPHRHSPRPAHHHRGSGPAKHHSQGPRMR